MVAGCYCIFKGAGYGPLDPTSASGLQVLSQHTYFELEY